MCLAWREQCIASFVSLSGVFGGTAETVLNQLQESSEGGGPPIPWAKDAEFATEQSFGSFSWMAAILPDSLLASAGDKVTYTAAQLPELFEAAGYERVETSLERETTVCSRGNRVKPVIAMLQSTEAFGSAEGAVCLSAPCRNDNENENENDNTARYAHFKQRLRHHGPYPPPNPKTECIVNTTDGDDTGTVESRGGAQAWAAQQEQPVHLIPLPGLGHDDTQRSSQAMDYVRRVLVNTSKTS